ncbi:MAG: hypothetical protein RMK19_04310 [Bacteroidia bacterium]|nr:hypothetical protein [Bacteroidia bacterium]MDW8015214.1 hypothetical protein [Bacteroidia bacterium]
MPFLAAGLFLFLKWACAQGAQPKLHTLPELRTKAPTVWIGLAWRHFPYQWEIGEVVTRMICLEAQKPPFSYWAESLGIFLSKWSGPIGAALSLRVPRSALIPAIEWLYELLAHFPQTPSLTWFLALRAYQREWEGFSLEKELFWRVCYPNQRPMDFSWEDLALYVNRYLAPESLHLVVGAELSFRERVRLSRSLFRSRMSFIQGTPPLPPSASSPDTVDTNLWAYPAYATLLLPLSSSWAEKIAYIGAFLNRWHYEAPPLRWQGRFWGDSAYLLQARLDRASYIFLRTLEFLAPRDSIELQAWQSAYKLFCASMRAAPELFLDIWIPFVLRGDTINLSDTLPTAVWQRGWKFRAHGIWLVNEWIEIEEERSSEDSLPILPSSEQEKISPPDFLWEGRGSPPLREWAAALRLFWEREERLVPCDLIGYYRRRKDQRALIKRLHDLRKTMIQLYGVPPQALRVMIDLRQPDFSPHSIRLKCY